MGGVALIAAVKYVCGGDGGGSVAMDVCVGVIVWVCGGVIAWARNGVLGWGSLDWCCKVCVWGERGMESVGIDVCVCVCVCDCVGEYGCVCIGE